MQPNRRDFIKITGLSTLGLMIGCSKGKPEKTIANLKAAYAEEWALPDRYFKCALKAKEDKLDKVALMFTAIAKAEEIHAANHKKVLDRLGEEYEPSIVNFETESTFESLLESYKSEAYDVQVMYPQFIDDATDDNVNDAVESLKWAKQTDSQHMGFYYVALTAVGTKSDLELPDKWYVCPTCGGTYPIADLKNTCVICDTSKSKFFEFI
jgi:rubrerythrin